MSNNILNSATFDDKQLKFVVSVQPYQVEGYGELNLRGMNNVLWVKHVGWKYVYKDVGAGTINVPTDARGNPLPPKPIEVSVESLFDREEEALPPFIQPKPVVGKVNFKVRNTNVNNNMKLEVTFYITGVLVSPRPGAEPPTTKQMLGYIMMDASTRGKLALEEAEADLLDETLTKMGLGSLRDAIPGGFGALKALPEPMQQVITHALISDGKLPSAFGEGMPAFGASNNQNALKALAMDSDPDREISVFIGDLLEASPEECEDIMTRKILKQLARSMVEKGWRRI